jgi:hypothetical protein
MTAPGIPWWSIMAASTSVGQASPPGGSSCAHSAASDQAASTVSDAPSTPDMCLRRSASVARYSRQPCWRALITAVAWPSASGRPARSSPRSSASIRWSGWSVSRELR